MKKLLGTFLVGALALAALAIAQPARAENNDAKLTEKVITAIQDYPPFGMFDDVTFTVDDRVVTLYGHVTRPIKKDELGKRVGKLDGVREIVNDIQVLPMSPMDDQVRNRVARAIYNHPSFWQYASMSQPPIHIIVEGGHVTLTGSVGNDMDRKLAYALAQVPGSLSVKNDLKVDGK